jgi:prepilin-type N-terminal cleavage/methylation domain-containing protein
MHKIMCIFRIPARRAFTLVELLTVIAIIGVLAGILVPVTSKVRLKAQRMDSIANLRPVGMAVALLTNDNKDKLPGPLSQGASASTAGLTRRRRFRLRAVTAIRRGSSGAATRAMRIIGEKSTT